jgi:hypothetical protein
LGSSGSLRVGTSSGLGHNYLINFEDGEDCINGQFNGPALNFHAVKDANFSDVFNLSISNINSDEVRFNIFGIKLSNDFLSFKSSIIGKSSGDNFERLTEFLNSVLVKTWLGLGEGLDLVSELNLGSSTSGQESVVLD